MVPVYIIMGFLESGKTTFLKDVFEENGFPVEESKLLIRCEDGEEEYDDEFLSDMGLTMIEAESLDDMEQGFMEKLHKKYAPKRVFIEFNGMWLLRDLFSKVKKPKSWELYQIITLIDGSTFGMYLNNMRSLFSEMVKVSELVIFNRCSEETDKGSYRRFVRAANPQAQMIFENLDGSSDDGMTEEELPYDMDAPVVTVKDEDYGIFYIDTLDHADRYDKKTLKLRGMVMHVKEAGLKKDEFFFCRRAMTCCADDIGLAGFVCHDDRAKSYKSGQWITLTATAKLEEHQAYGGVGIVLYAKKIGEAKMPEDDLVYFN